MIQRQCTVLISIVLFACFAQPAATATFEWNNVERVVVVPDVHGAYPALVELLQSTGVIDTNLRWSGGSTHLVSLGDLLDRGDQSRQTMDLLMRLQPESVQAGGRVHVVAGNHELMNLIGDLRYVSKGEFAAFATDETELMRAAPQESPKPRPPGYFAHRQAFSASGVYGRWLLSLPAIIKINDIAYAHGGLPSITASMSLNELNALYSKTLTDYLTLWKELVASGVLPDDQDKDAGELAQSAMADAQESQCLKERADTCATAEQTAQLQQFILLSRADVLTADGPLWYRGAAYCRALFEQPVLQSALKNIGAARVIVGHTTTPDARVHTLLNGQLTLLDTGMLTAYYKGRPAALVIENNRQHVQFLSPTEIAQPVDDDYPGAYNLSSAGLLKAAHLGDISVLDKRAHPWSVQVSYQGAQLIATFTPDEKDHAAKRELAAYHLDKLLGFELVPPTAQRETDGTPGALQIVYDKGLTEQQRQDSNKHIGGWCSPSRQLQLMYAWDLLTANGGRNASNIFYQLPLWRLQLTEHKNAFGNNKRLPKTLNKDALDLDPQVRDALTQVTREDLQKHLGEFLDNKSIDAVLRRRDALIKLFR